MLKIALFNSLLDESLIIFLAVEITLLLFFKEKIDCHVFILSAGEVSLQAVLLGKSERMDSLDSFLVLLGNHDSVAWSGLLLLLLLLATSLLAISEQELWIGLDELEDFWALLLDILHDRLEHGWVLADRLSETDEHGLVG